MTLKWFQEVKTRNQLLWQITDIALTDQKISRAQRGRTVDKDQIHLQMIKLYIYNKSQNCIHQSFRHPPTTTRKEWAGAQHKLLAVQAVWAQWATFTIWETLGTLLKFKFPEGSQGPSCQLSKDSSLRLHVLTFSFQFLKIVIRLT